MTISKITAATVVSLCVSVAHAEDKFVKCVFYDSQTQNKENVVTEAGWLMKGEQATAIPSYTYVRYTNKDGQKNLDEVSFSSHGDLTAVLKYDENTKEYRMLKSGEIYMAKRAPTSVSSSGRADSNEIVADIPAPQKSTSVASENKPRVIGNLSAPQPTYRDRMLESARCITTSLTPSNIEQAQREETNKEHTPATSTSSLHGEEKKAAHV